ncbi:MAG: hypothetical protein ACXACX_21770 [Candidatus Hodarchaeales archaeon]|jgi:hypothetical protein
MSFIDEMNQIKAEHDNQIKEKRDAFHTSVRKRNKQMKELIDENLKIVEDGGTTGDEIIDVILRGRKHVDVYSDRLSIPREGAISYTLNLRKELEENRGKFVGSETKREEPIEFITFEKFGDRPRTDSVRTGELGVITENGDVMYVEKHESEFVKEEVIYINTDSRHARVVSGGFQREDPHIVEGDVYYSPARTYGTGEKVLMMYFEDLKELLKGEA